MMRRYLFSLTVTTLIALTIWWIGADPAVWMAVRGYRMVVIPGIVGPPTVSSVPDDLPTSWSRYGEGGVHRLAVLLTDPQSNWLALVHGLKAKGIPFVITDQPEQALRHRVVLVYPTISGKVLSRHVLQRLASYPRGGSTLIACGVVGGGLDEMFGIKAARDGHTAATLRFHGDPWSLGEGNTASDRAKDWIVPLRHPQEAEPPIGAVQYQASTAKVLASYDDGSAAVVQRSIGSGWTVAIGIDVGYVLWRGQTLRAEGFTGSFNNRFTPGTDAVLLLLEAVYRRGDPWAVTLDPIPDGKELAVLLTHDIDAQTSMRNALTFAQEERARGVLGTFFIQTKYLRDFNDEVFLTEEWIHDMRQLAALGMEIGSHTVAHSKVFDQFPLGTGTEQYPEYRPVVTSRLSARGGTVFGELRVSKFLLETLVPGVRVRSFRAGELAYPLTLPQALAATGYRYDSTATANTALTHLPYRLLKDRLRAEEVEAYEFPVSIEDEELPLLGARFPLALKLAEQLGWYGGVMTVLIHPNILDHKLRFEIRLIEALKAKAWIGALNEFGQWWESRDDIQADVVETPQGVHLHVAAHEAIRGLTVLLPSLCTVERTEFIKSPRPWASTAVVVSLEPGSQQVLSLANCRASGSR